MILMHYFIILFFSHLQLRVNSAILQLNPQYQFKEKNINDQAIQIENPDCIYYGIYTRYNPLSNIQQVGEIGILDSNCFHIFRAIDNIMNVMNFLYYDCIDYKKQQIEKSYIFIGDSGKIFKHSCYFNMDEYESQWYYLKIIINLIEKKLTIVIFQHIQLVHIQEFNTQYLHQGSDLQFIYGGGFQINTNQSLYDPQLSKFSYFPGSYYYESQNIQACQNISYISFNFFTCECKLNLISNIPDSIISNLDQQYYISQYLNCDSFNFQTWVRIKERNYYIKNTYYQLIKISANFINPKLIDGNLCAFQLFYHLTESINQIIITTYSYTIPIVNIDLLDTPFQITKAFDIDINIQLWHLVRVKKDKNSISVKIYFYEKSEIKEYSFESVVNHFNRIQFKITYGNLLQTYNYLTIQLVNMIFFNCNKEINLEQCHQSCFNCDGPTKFDCLSCDPYTNRIYNIKQKACVCIYGKIDLDGECKDYTSFQLNIVQGNKEMFKCQYGYFEVEYQCWKCPSKIREKLITCIECIINPKSWIKNPYCQYNFVADNNENIFSKIDNGIEEYFFDGNEIKLSENQNNHLDIYSDYIQTYAHFTDFCQNCQIDLMKESCFIFENCVSCEIQLSKPICTKCRMLSVLKDGVCQFMKNILDGNVVVCETPFYQTYYFTCIQCPIANCLYCFDYLKDDVQKNTIFYKFVSDPLETNDQQVLVGCAQCIQGYIFDFTIGQCIYTQPTIQNCLRSFFNQQGKELCILSSLDDFSVAPQITNCQKYILHCEQCIQNIQTLIKCLICDTGYMPSSSTGLCELIHILSYSKSVMSYTDSNIWRYLVKSFQQQFTHINFFYESSYKNLYIVECQDGYSLIQRQCRKYCDQNCQQCEKKEITQEFTCTKCSLNLYQQPYRVQENGKCIICHSLCLVCQIRSNDSIMITNPYYIINEQNTQYTTQCIKSISDQNIYIDPYYQIVNYIYDTNQIAIQYELIWDCETHWNVDIVDENDFFGNNFDFSYFNEIGLQQFILKIQLGNYCKPPGWDYFAISNLIQTKVFSIQLIKLILNGDKSTQSILKLFKIDNFNQVEINNFNLMIENTFKFQFSNRGEAIDYQILNSRFYSDKLKSFQFEIPINVYQIFNIYNVSIFNAIIDNSIIFQINSVTQDDNIIIDYFSLIDCIINNSILFNFNTTSKNIIIENLLIDRCELNNSIILNIQQSTQSKINIKSIIIKNSILSNSSFISSQDNNLLFIYSFSMIENNILNSQLIKFSMDLFSFKLVLKQNLFKQSIIFAKQLSMTNQYEIKINDIEIILNEFQNFQVLVIDQNKITPIQIEFMNFVFKDNKNTQNLIQEYLFKFSCFNVLIQNVSIINTFNHRYFDLFNISQINLRNVSMYNEIQEYRIPINQDCAINNYQHSKLLSVKGFSNLYLDLIKFINQITIDLSFIEIQSNDRILNEQSETIIIQNITSIGNILMKINQGYIFSIISIYSDKIQYITFENILYQENSYYQYIVDPTFSSASLLFINSMNSSILLQNIQCYENSLTNSSNSFITISTSEVKVVQIKVFYHNYLRMQFWNKYYEIQLQSNLNQIEVNYMIQQILLIKNKGGVMQLITEKFTLENGQFQYLIAQSSSILDIITKGTGIIILNNCSIAYSQNVLLSNSEYEGSISINSKNSYLTFRISNLNFREVHNKLASAIISLQPSEISNNILIRNVQISNCFSLINLFFELQFLYENADKNQVILENIIIQQSEQSLIQFNRQLNILEPIILSKITQTNAIFNIQGCVLKIRNLKFNGFTLSSIFNIINCKKIQLMDILFYQSTIFYNLNLLQIEQIAQFQSIIQIQNLKINKLNIFNRNNMILSFYIYPNYLIDYTKCQQLKVVQIPTNQKQLETKYNIFEQIQSYSTQNGSILYIKCSNNQTKLYLKSIILQYNDCNIFRNGLIYFQLIDFHIILIEELQCIGNIVQQYGCITALSDNKLQGKLKIIKSLFINNTGSQGIAVTSINVKTFLSNIKILNNTASVLGGGLYFDINPQEFQINLAYIQNNNAREGGGVYLNGESYLNQINFIKSLLNLNKAEFSTNNLQELPSHLDLSINHQLMKSTFDKLQIKSLKLSPYKIIQQGKVQIVNKLMIPSNQQIIKYELYNPNQKKFKQYINEFSIQFKNRFNEQLLNLTNTKCQIIESIFDIKKQTILESNNISLIYFNQTTNKVDLGMLIFTLDPYNQTDNQYEIQIYCNTINSIEELQFNIKVNSLMCQLGEFYVLNGCLICQSQQGFYSVTYNATKCSIFDKIKFLGITSNNINLKPGYWRPHQESDLINECFKNIESCKGGWVVGDDICNIGHIGGLCEECDKHNIRGDGYYFKNDQNTCLNCSDFSMNFLSLILITLWVFLSTIITLSSAEKTNQLFVQFKLTQKYAHIMFKMNLSQESILLKLFLNYIWIFSVIFTFNIQFSFSFIFVNQMSDTSYFLTRNLDCEISQTFEIELIYLRVLVMFALIILQIFIIQLGVNIFSILTKTKFRNNIFSITLIYLYIQNYATLINQLFSILAKREISQINYVQGDVSLLFNSSNHQSWMYKFALPISLLIGLMLPMSLLLFLYKKRKQFNKIQLRRHIGYLFNEYNINSSFWEWVKLWKKTIIIVILIYFETNIFFKGILISMCLIIYQIITTSYLPYIYPKLNKLDLSSGQFCSIAIFLASIQYLCEQQNDYIQARIVQILIILLCFRFSFPYLYDMISAYYGKYKITIITLFIMILNQLKPKSNLIFKLRDKLDQINQKSQRIERNFKKLKQLTISKKKQETNEQIKNCVPTLSLNRSGEFKFKLLNQ